MPGQYRRGVHRHYQTQTEVASLLFVYDLQPNLTQEINLSKLPTVLTSSFRPKDKGAGKVQNSTC